MTPLVKPTPENDDRKRELVEARIAELAAARQLLNKMHAAAPDGRDYPDLDAYELARTAWTERIEMIERFYGQIETEAMRITLG